MTKISKSVGNRHLSESIHAAWQILHGVLAYKQDFQIETANGRESALQYLMQGGEISGWNFSRGSVLKNGRTGLRSKLATGSYAGQGHADQWLAVLAQAGLSTEQSLVVDGSPYTMQDFLDQTLEDISTNHLREYSWTLIGVCAYLPTSHKWVAADGREWSIAQLVQHEINQSSAGRACGGTHRLIGIAMALEKRKNESNESLNGSVWGKAADHLREFADAAKQFQNADGSFSNNYFLRPGISADNAKVLASTGHTLEFLALTLPPNELKQAWVLRAVNRLCNLLEEAEGQPLECGALYHAIHGLNVFLDRTEGVQS